MSALFCRVRQYFHTNHEQARAGNSVTCGTGCCNVTSSRSARRSRKLHQVIEELPVRALIEGAGGHLFPDGTLVTISSRARLSDGLDVLRRPDANPLCVLGLVIKQTAQAQAVA